MKLEDPIINRAVSDELIKSDKRIHSFTNHVAPLVLALYFLGHYLSNYHTPLMDDHVHIDPIFGGGILISSGIFLLGKSIDGLFLSPS